MSQIGSIYKTIGKEVEYSPFALDLYPECSHRCKYCYVNWNAPRQKYSLMNLDRELKRLAFLGDRGIVTISFVSDPYDKGRKDNSYTRNVLELFRKNNHPFQVLTKGGTMAISDFDLYGPDDRFGASLTFDNEIDSKTWEPGAALPADRIEALRLAHEKGIKTFVSLEPVIEPDQTLHLIELTHEFIDFYWVGKINHNAELEGKIKWSEFRLNAETILRNLNKNFKVKKELALYPLPKGHNSLLE